MTGRPLYVQRRGRGDALMLLHGFTGSSRSMAGLARGFEDEYDTLAPDLPGHGQSTAPSAAARCGFEDCVDDLLATLDASGHPRAHWLGYSMGARLALGCAVRRPAAVASLLLVGARAGIADPAQRAARRTEDEALANRIERDGIEPFVDEWMARPLFDTQRRLGPSFLAEARRERLANSARGLADSLRGMGPGAQPPLFDALPRVTAPTLLVVGALDDPFVAAAHDLAGRMPNAEVRELAEAGHAAHLEQPAAFIGIARDFLRRVAHAHTDRQIPLKETLS